MPSSPPPPDGSPPGAPGRALLRLLPLFRGSAGLLASALIGLWVAAGASLAGPWLVARAIDVALAAGDASGLVRIALVYAATVAVGAVATWAARVALEIVAQRAMLELKLRLFDHLVDHDQAFHDTHAAGRLLTRVQGDTEALRVLFAEVVWMVPADLALFLGMFAVIGWTAPPLVVPVFAVLPVYTLLFLGFRVVAPGWFLQVRKVKARLTGFLADQVRAMPMLQTYDREAWARARAHEAGAELYQAELRAGLLPVAYFNTATLGQRLGMVATLLGGGAMLATGRVSLGELVLGLGYLRLMFQPLNRLSNQLATLERARAAAVRVVELLDTPRTVLDPVAPRAWPGVRDGLRLEGVAFAYQPGTPTLERVDLEFPSGRHTGIVGATGAGKSTVLALLLRFRDPTAGRVTVDGVDVRDLKLADLRRHVALVQQDVHLLPGTLLDNLGGDREAARRALDVIGLDLDLDRIVGEAGGGLSRGERQLLAFARALVHDPEVLVLDEATSAVDPATERRVQEALARVSRGRTVISVAHRLATVRGCDRIYTLQAGRVVEAGNHQELLARDGLYAGLARLQGVAA